MRVIKIITAVLLALYAQLVFAHNVSLGNAAPDFVFVLVCFAAMSLRPNELVPMAVGSGLCSDLIMGAHLGPQALGYGVGVLVFERVVIYFKPKLGEEAKPAIKIYASAILATFLATLIAEFVVASLGRGVIERLMQAVSITWMSTLTFMLFMPPMLFLGIEFNRELNVRGS